MLLLVVMALMLLLGQAVQVWDLVVGLLVTEWVLIAAPVLLFVRLRRLDPRRVLALRPAGGAPVWGGTLLAGVSGWLVVGALVEYVQQRVFPMPPEMMKEMQEVLFGAGRPLAVDLAVLALSPAVCEELLFRGVVLRAAQDRLEPWGVAVVVGVLFGLFHLSPYRFVPTVLLGVVLTVIVLRTGSLFPAILFHFLNNAMAVVAGRLVAHAATPPEVAAETDPRLVAGAALVFLVGMVLLGRGRAPRSQGPDAG